MQITTRDIIETADAGKIINGVIISSAAAAAMYDVYRSNVQLGESHTSPAFQLRTSFVTRSHIILEVCESLCTSDCNQNIRR
jgi:hypothetical protein